MEDHEIPVISVSGEKEGDILLSLSGRISLENLEMVNREFQSRLAGLAPASLTVDLAGVDYLLRDLRSANLFQGVFPYRNNESSRYLLAGDVEEFQEYIDKENHQAFFSLTITLLDTARPRLPDRILFQKNYRIAQPIDEKSPAGLAKGMNRAMAQVSSLLLSDIINVVQTVRVLEKGDTYEK